MLQDAKIADIARQVFAAKGAREGLEQVLAKEITDSEGEPALRITLVLAHKTLSGLSGDQALDLLVGIQQDLEREGEQRLPIVEYATRDDLIDEPLDEDDGDEEG